MTVIGTKVCVRCTHTKPLTLFHIRKTRNQPDSYCIECRRAMGRTWWRDNAATQKPKRQTYRQSTADHRQQYNREYGFRRYSLTRDQFDQLLASQNNSCAICGTTDPGGRGRFHIDHDHTCCAKGSSCGQCIRGLLCATCNQVLGLFADNSTRLRQAAAYLERQGLENQSTLQRK